MTNLRYDVHFAIRVKTFMQPPESALTSEALAASFKGARREMIELHTALTRVLNNHGYAMDLDSLRGNLRTTVDNGKNQDAPQAPPDPGVSGPAPTTGG